MKALKQTILLTGLALLASILPAGAQKPAIQQLTPQILQEASRFNDGVPARVAGQKTMGWQECHVLKGNGVRILVDAVNGKVTLVEYLPGQIGPNQISQDEAESRTRIWLDDHAVSLDKYVIEEKRIVEHGTAPKEYVFRWTQRSPTGVLLPAIVEVRMGDTGYVRSFWRVERAVTVSLVANISVLQLVTTARIAANAPKSDVIGQQIRVWYDETGQQRLLWDVRLKDGNNEHTVIIDAHTGRFVADMQTLRADPPKKN